MTYTNERGAPQPIMGIISLFTGLAAFVTLAVCGFTSIEHAKSITDFSWINQLNDTAYLPVTILTGITLIFAITSYVKRETEYHMGAAGIAMLLGLSTGAYVVLVTSIRVIL